MDAVIKIGGSLAEDPEQLKALCIKLSEFAKKYAIVVVPGGGSFADVVRDFDQRFNLSSGISHRMAILGMDQFGLLLSQIIPNSCATYLLNDAKQLSEIRIVPIFLPSRLMFREDPLESSWDVTSDSIATYVASRLHVAKVLLVTDVDGIFTKDPKKHSDAALIKQLSAEELLKSKKRTSVDGFLPKLVIEAQVDCYVVNGKYPERIEAILSGHQATCTLIATATK
ncbi:MAG: delta 1-pyrroline-5-carboxylate synthetase [Candidatus Bathyarchaeota archaeon]|nr:MAG: delta 1-pyrroline-5-carboxylate synthetase [Candidatus Bathyarchaeota archaeon]